MLKVLLFNPSSDRLIIKDQYCSFTSKAAYYWIPIDLLVISGQLREDFEVRVLDPNVEKIKASGFEDFFEEFKPDFVVILSSALTYQNDLRLIRKLKNKHTFHASFVGDIFYRYSEKMISLKGIDSILLAYPCEGLADFIRNRTPSPSILTLGHSAVPVLGHNNKIVPSYLPQHELFLAKKYSVPFDGGKKSTLFLTSMGCSFCCNYCPASRVPYQKRKFEDMISELDLLKSIGVKRFWLRDFTFGLDAKDTFRFLDLLKNHYDFDWYCHSRPSVLSPEMIVGMKDAGCFLVMLGVDSLVQKTLEKEKRLQSYSQIKNKIDELDQNGIAVLLHQILGFETESPWDMFKTSWMLRKTKALYLSINFLSYRPGTGNFEFNEPLSYSEYELDSFFPHHPSKRHHPNMLRLIKVVCLVLFYSRLKRIYSIVKSFKSFDEFVSIVKTGFLQIWKT